MIGRIVRSVDFERVMAAPPRAKSRHFVLHHLADVPSVPLKPKAVRSRLAASSNQEGCPGMPAATVDPEPAEADLSTSPDIAGLPLVDDCRQTRGRTSPQAVWLGMVVPKRHAKRSVTRNLIKRHIKAAMHCQQQKSQALSQGLWVVRLRAPFDPSQHSSAASSALASVAREELAALLDQAATPARKPGTKLQAPAK